ncbi:MAG TPA: 16S rRNA (cytosine(1402)-N(4))-methyltransferase RsmH [Candidatus Peribacterales bacterium]|nr:16S rRNA (cytosine(1402)-N(4))-methyltransferase RsmH [Candidatus Peribacterales bacterium]
MSHTPVLLREVIDHLHPQSGETVIDLTVGLGGHAKAFSEKIGSKGKLIGLDADEKNLAEATKNIAEKNVQFLHVNFRELPTLNLPLCDILFADLGLSSPHIDDPQRGFTFREDSPLDCRFDQTHGEPASLLLERASEEELVRIFGEYGELRFARTLAQEIMARRAPQAFGRSSDLVRAVEKVFSWKAKKVLPQIFQALRIAVNDEMGALSILLDYGPSLLKPGGRFGIISYHSLEDRMVKRRFQELAGIPGSGVFKTALVPTSYTLLTKKPVQPTMEEIQRNPRSRSAVFRILQKQ